MRLFIFICFGVVSLLNGASTTAKIQDSQKNLSAASSEKAAASRQLSKIANDIQSAEKDIVYLEKMIDELESDQEKTEQEYEVLKAELDKSEKEYIETNKALEEKRRTFIALLSEQFSIVFAMEQAHEPTRKSILSQEVYSAYKIQNSKVLSTLKSDIGTLKKQKENKIYMHNKAKNEIASIIKKREDYAQKKSAKEILRKRLSVDEEKYNAKLQQIEDKQNSLRSTLAQLNILHANEVEEAQKLAAARKEAIRLEKERKKQIRQEQELARINARKAQENLKQAKTEEDKTKARLAVTEADKEKNKVYKESETVRQINSSYKQSQTYAYKGGKTISPLPGGKLIKKFGTYVDPIYKIKIFNESITLQSSSSNAKVVNILNGKVVFSGQSSMLGKVVVVAHSGKIHTVYAGLSKIAPTIQVGSKIQRGYVVGKVASKLMFQATKDSKHINPMELIKI